MFLEGKARYAARCHDFTSLPSLQAVFVYLSDAFMPTAKGALSGLLSPFGRDGIRVARAFCRDSDS